MTTISDNLVERAAQAIWDENMLSMPDDTPAWDIADESDQDDYRDLARAAINVIIPAVSEQHRAEVEQLHATIRDLEQLCGFPAGQDRPRT